MTTVIVFADLYRDRPLVLKAYAQTFDLLFHQENENVVARREWRSENEKADVVLRISRKDHSDVEDEDGVVTACWKILEHPSSPSSVVNTVLWQKADVTPIERVRTWTSGDVGASVGSEDPSRVVLPGSVFQFALCCASRAREYRMMLFYEVEDEEALTEMEVEEEPVEGQAVEEVQKPTLADLPDLPLRKIVGYLDPTPSTLLALPLISSSIFDFMKREPDLRALEIGSPCPGLADLDALCLAARETCVRLKVSPPNGGLLETADWVLNKVLAQFEWSNLKSLELGEVDACFFAETVQHALRKNNFPKLELLRISPQDCGHSSRVGRWRFFARCRLAKLRELVAERVDPAGLWADVEGAGEFFGQFPNLEKFHLVYGGRKRPFKPGSDVKLVLIHGFEAGLVPRLKELKVVAYCAPTFAGVAFCHTGLERLAIGVPKPRFEVYVGDDDSEYGDMDHENVGGVDIDDEYDPNNDDAYFNDYHDHDFKFHPQQLSLSSSGMREIDSGQLFSRFPGLKSLSLTPDFAVMWNSPGWQLANLRELRCVHGEGEVDGDDEVPFEKLNNLEHLWLHLLENLDQISLVALPNLRVLKLTGKIKWESLPKLLPTLPCNLRILHLDLTDAVDVHEANSKKFVQVFVTLFSQVDVLCFGSFVSDSSTRFSRHVCEVKPHLVFDLEMERSSSESAKNGREKQVSLRFPLPADADSKPLHGKATFKKILPAEEGRQIEEDPFEDPFFC